MMPGKQRGPGWKETAGLRFGLCAFGQLLDYLMEMAETFQYKLKYFTEFEKIAEIVSP